MSIVKKYSAEVVSIENPFDKLFIIKMKSLSGYFKYSPGQFLHLAIDKYDPSEGWPDSRCFSMQSTTRDDFIKITYAVKGVFTQRMASELTIGKLVTLKLPYGDLFTQYHSKENTIFISGGTGITPFLSLFTNPNFSSYINPCLYAGFRAKKLNLYHDEIEIAKQLNIGLKVKNIYQDEDGILDIKQIFTNSSSGSCFFISGPPLMIKSFRNFLAEQGVGREKIKTDYRE